MSSHQLHSKVCMIHEDHPRGLRVKCMQQSNDGTVVAAFAVNHELGQLIVFPVGDQVTRCSI